MPPGHPPLSRYLGVPIMDRGEVIGMFAIANAPQDYPDELVDWLKPFTSTCALLINLYRLFKEQQRFTEELQQARDQARAGQAPQEGPAGKRLGPRRLRARGRIVIVHFAVSLRPTAISASPISDSAPKCTLPAALISASKPPTCSNSLRIEALSVMSTR